MFFSKAIQLMRQILVITNLSKKSRKQAISQNFLFINFNLIDFLIYFSQTPRIQLAIKYVLWNQPRNNSIEF